MFQYVLRLALASALLGGCATTLKTPPTLGAPENAESYGYHPIDPLPVQIETTAPPSNTQILSVLPDETMRIAIGEIQSNGGVTFGTATTGVAGRTYVVVLDYIKFQTQSFLAEVAGSGTSKTVTGSSPRKMPNQPAQSKATIVPVYLGVGLRLTANVNIREGSVDLGNLFALGVAAQAKQVTGTMVVQTLGVSGQNISTLIPMPGEINPTTIQNAIMALGAIKAKLYDTGTAINPRVVGVYNTLGGGQETINSFIATLLENPQTVAIP